MDKKELFNHFVSFTSSVYRVTHELTKNAKSHSLSPVQYKILELIAVEQPVTPSDINDCLAMAMPNTSRELKKLSEKHLIEKISDPQDRRKQTIRLSKDGEVLMNETFSIVESRFLKRIEGVTDEELQAIHEAFDILKKKVFY